MALPLGPRSRWHDTLAHTLPGLILVSTVLARSTAITNNVLMLRILSLPLTALLELSPLPTTVAGVTTLNNFVFAAALRGVGTLPLDVVILVLDGIIYLLVVRLLVGAVLPLVAGPVLIVRTSLLTAALTVLGAEAVPRLLFPRGEDEVKDGVERVDGSSDAEHLPPLRQSLLQEKKKLEYCGLRTQLESTQTRQSSSETASRV